MSKQPIDLLIQEQAKRLLTLPGRPESAVEIAVALKRYGRTEHHVKGIVQYLLDTCTFFPAPVAVRDAAEMCPHEPPVKYRTPNPDCAFCGGSGWNVIAEKNAADICPCRIIGAELPPNREPGEPGGFFDMVAVAKQLKLAKGRS